MTESVNILVVDDHADIRDLIKRFLEQLYYLYSTGWSGNAQHHE